MYHYHGREELRITAFRILELVLVTSSSPKKLFKNKNVAKDACNEQVAIIVIPIPPIQ